MSEKYIGDIDFVKKVFAFLKKVLGMVEEKKPFRGLSNFEGGDFLYGSFVKGNVERFSGVESIKFNGKEVFRQSYIGGLIVGKD